MEISIQTMKLTYYLLFAAVAAAAYFPGQYSDNNQGESKLFILVQFNNFIIRFINFIFRWYYG